MNLSKDEEERPRDDPLERHEEEKLYLKQFGIRFPFRLGHNRIVFRVEDKNDKKQDPPKSLVYRVGVKIAAFIMTVCILTLLVAFTVWAVKQAFGV